MARSTLEIGQEKQGLAESRRQLALFDSPSNGFDNSLVNLSVAVGVGECSPDVGPSRAIGRVNAITPASEADLRESEKPLANRGSPMTKCKGKKMPVTATKMARPKATKSATDSQTAKLSRRDRVVMENLPLVKAIAVRVHESLPVHVDLDDLVHAGILGLFDAATKYNPDKKVVFSSYAKHRIKGAILDSLRQLDWASRDLRRRHKQVEQITRELAATLHRAPTEDELAAKMGVNVSRWRQMALDLRNCGLISASTRPNDQEDLPAPEFPSKPETQPDSMCAREQLREVLESAMSLLPERYKKVVVLYYTNEMTMKEIGGLMGINESRVSQIHKSALEKMAVVLQENGITSCRAF